MDLLPGKRANRVPVTFATPLVPEFEAASHWLMEIGKVFSAKQSRRFGAITAPPKTYESSRWGMDDNRRCDTAQRD